MKNLFFIFLLVSVPLYSQASKNIDSLFLVKDYLQNIRTTVNSKINNQKKTEKLDSLIRTATKYKTIFDRNIRAIVKIREEETELRTAINFILQSMVLYRSDLKDRSENRTEILYLNKNIPILINKIYYHTRMVNSAKYQQ
ncbi:hypothetical protein [Epilithonimonas mollis]|uniref:Uncharacterized protein n=1 Tax=Epilithonimonas mollis TaxID=216903 RepID=A0A1M6TFK3_9FLAO|nr:hypothetical protein [Epilithonimonas mollis]SHK55743.1 hypothetical protein SAMN05444371_2845 [Epilithonimonas mollis]